MNPMITNIGLMLVVNKLAGKLDFEDPFVVNVVRGCYVASTIIVFLIYFYTHHLIEKRNDLATFTYEKPGSLFNPQETKESITQTHKGYDLEQVNSAIKGALPGILMLMVSHFYMGYTHPLVLQSIMPLKSALEAPVVQIHLLGRTNHTRPFTAPSMFGAPAAKEEEAKPAVEASSATTKNTPKADPKKAKAE